MKRICSVLLILLISFAGFAQKVDNKAVDDLRKKSRRAMTTGIIMVSTGPVLAAGGIGAVIYGLASKDDSYATDIYGNYVVDAYGNFVHDNKSSDQAILYGSIAAALGITLALTSIHFMSRSRHFRSLAKAKLRSSAENLNIPRAGYNLTYSPVKQMQLTLSIPLGR